MKKLLVIAFVVTSAFACGKKTPAAKAPDAKMEGGGEKKADPCAGKDPCAAKDPCAGKDPCAPK